jgi:histidine triad (HIT) family protein
MGESIFHFLRWFSVEVSTLTNKWLFVTRSQTKIQKTRPEDTIFAKIVRKEVPAKIVFEDPQAMCFQDINPVAPSHYLIIPKKPIAGIGEATDEDAPILGHLLLVAQQVAKQLGLHETGYRLVINYGRHGQQSIRWLHIHLIGGRQLHWPPG